MGCPLPSVAVLVALAAAAPAATPSPGAVPAGGEWLTPEANEVERVVAVVRSPAQTEPHVITLTRLQEETRIALVTRGAVLAALEPLDGAALRDGLERLVDQTLLLDEATRLQVFESDRGEVAEELAAFRKRFAAPGEYESFLARTELTEADLREALGRSVRVRRYVESRVARAGRDPERVAAQVRALARDLRARAEVRILADLGPAPAAREAR